MRELTRDECFEVFKKYDPKAYEYYSQNAWFFGYNARNYAAWLLREKGGQIMDMVDWHSAGKVYLDKGIALELLDEIDEFRRNHQDEKKDPSDFCMRAIEAIIAKRCGMPSRADWTGELKARPSRYRRDLDAHGPGF